MGCVRQWDTRTHEYLDLAVAFGSHRDDDQLARDCRSGPSRHRRSALAVVGAWARASSGKGPAATLCSTHSRGCHILPWVLQHPRLVATPRAKVSASSSHGRSRIPTPSSRRKSTQDAAVRSICDGWMSRLPSLTTAQVRMKPRFLSSEQQRATTNAPTSRPGHSS